MIVTGNETVVVQGITGKQGSFWTERMIECGTNVVAGATPKKGGQTVAGIPVYDSVVEAAKAHRLDVAVMFVPPLAAKAAVLDAIDAGVRKVVFLTEHVPVPRRHARTGRSARPRTSQVLGPNTAGLVVPGEASVGIMPGFAKNIFQPGNIGVVSRSGSLGTLLALNLVTAGYGQSAFIGIGGDPILGTTTADAVRILDADPRTDAIVLVGEIGGTHGRGRRRADRRDRASRWCRSSPAAALRPTAGWATQARSSPAHRGSGQSKVDALSKAGVAVIDVPSQVAPALQGFSVMPTGTRVNT